MQLACRAGQVLTPQPRPVWDVWHGNERDTAVQSSAGTVQQPATAPRPGMALSDRGLIPNLKLSAALEQALACFPGQVSSQCQPLV